RERKAIGARARRDLRDPRGVEPVTFKERGETRERVAAVRRPEDVREQELRLRHPDIDAETFGKPSGETQVIRMQVRDDDARDWAALEPFREHLVPELLRVGVAEPGIDERPAV